MGRNTAWPTKVIVTLACTALFASAHATSAGGATAVQDASTDSAGSWFPEVAESGDLDGQAIVSGVLYEEDGETPSAGTPIALLANATSEARLAAIETSDYNSLTPKTPLGKGVTDSDGKFAIRVDPSSELQRVTSKDGYIDATLLAKSVNGWAPYAFTIHTTAADSPDDERRAQIDPASGATRESIDVTLRLNHGVAPDDATYEAGPESGTGSTQASTLGGDVGILGLGKCPNDEMYQSWDLGTHWVNVGEILNDDPTVKSGFVYTTGAESEIGVAFSLTGEIGGFEQSGTRTTSGGFSDEVAPVSGRHVKYQDTEFRFIQECHAVQINPTDFTHHYEVSALHHAGGYQERETVMPEITNEGHCFDYPGTHDVAKQETHAITWTNGVKISGAIGIDLSSRTGFTESATTKYHGVDMKICGTEGDISGGEPRRVAVVDLEGALEYSGRYFPTLEECDAVGSAGAPDQDGYWTSYDCTPYAGAYDLLIRGALWGFSGVIYGDISGCAFAGRQELNDGLSVAYQCRADGSAYQLWTVSA